jgi:hypothetical protein
MTARRDTGGFGFAVVVMVMLVLLTGVLLTAMRKAEGHDAPLGWSYDNWCCNGDEHEGDCQPVPESAVQSIDGGYQITLKPGEHHLVTEPHTWTRTMKQSRWSKDENYHVCLYPNEDTLRCFYAPPMGF